jgi:hypothetical protein
MDYKTKPNKTKKKYRKYKQECNILEDLHDNLVIIYEGKVNIYFDKAINIYIFENDKYTTYDIFEGITLLILNIGKNDKVWDITLPNILNYNIDYTSGLYQLSGGYNEWNTGFYYTKKWYDVDTLYVDEFKDVISDILIMNRELRLIRTEILFYLSMSRLYNFAIKRKIIKL